MNIVLLDTNFLMIPYQFKIDIFSELDRLIPEGYKIVILSTVVDELKKIQEIARGKDKISARIGLQLIEKKNLEIIEGLKITKGLGRADKAILDFACQNKENTIVCTNDKGIKRILKENDIRIICMRGKRKLECV